MFARATRAPLFIHSPPPRASPIARALSPTLRVHRAHRWIISPFAASCRALVLKTRLVDELHALQRVRGTSAARKDSRAMPQRTSNQTGGWQLARCPAGKVSSWHVQFCSPPCESDRPAHMKVSAYLEVVTRYGLASSPRLTSCGAQQHSGESPAFLTQATPDMVEEGYSCQPLPPQWARTCVFACVFVCVHSQQERILSLVGASTSPRCGLLVCSPSQLHLAVQCAGGKKRKWYRINTECIINLIYIGYP